MYVVVSYIWDGLFILIAYKLEKSNFQFWQLKQ